MTRRFGVHGNNWPNLSGADLDAWQQVQPGLVVLCQPDWGLVPEIRRRIPGATIVGRVFEAGRVSAWHPPYADADAMRAYGDACRVAGEAAGIDILQYANEPGIDDLDPAWWTVEGYRKLARGAAWFAEGWGRSAVRLGTIPLSPGHQEDDGLLGAAILRPAWVLHDVLLLHTYWTREGGSVESEWFGGRYRRQLAAYRWTGPWAITEWNRDEPTPPGDAERASLADDARRWFAGLRGDDRFLGAAFFIWKSGDPAFSRLQMHNNPPLIEAARAINAEEATMATTPTIHEYSGPAVIQSGTTATLSGRFAGIDGTGIFTAILHYPLADDGVTALATDGVRFGYVAADGTWSTPMDVPVMAITHPIGASLQLNTAEISPDVTFDGARFDIPITITPPDGQTPPLPQEEALLPEYDAIFALAGVVHDKGGEFDKTVGLRIHDLIRWRKGEIADPFPTARR